MLYTINSIAPVCRKLHAAGHKLVLATGFFDLLHAEHITFLQKAKAQGDILIVALESDARARKLKGEGRPIESQLVRAEHISALTTPGVISLVDYVILLGDDFDNHIAYESLIKITHPQIYAVSSHTNYLENKKLLVEKYDGKLVVVHNWNPAISTTQLIQKNNV